MKNNWRIVKFKDVVEFPPKIQLRKDEEYDFIEMEDVNPQKRYVYAEKTKKFDSSSVSKFENDDIVFARITPCLQNSKIAQVKLTDGRKGFGSTEFFVFRPKLELIDRDFLYYLCKSDVIRLSAINSMTGASGRQRADRTFVQNIEFKLPPIDEQKKIGEVLKNYDQLIYNNNKRIETLEKIAQEIYKEWFVRMRFPGYESTKFIKGIPVEWEEAKLSELANIVMGQSPSSEFYNDISDGLPFHQGVSDFNFRFPNNEVYCTQIKKIANKGDILFSVRAPVGRLNIAISKMVIGRGLAAIRHKEELNFYLYYALQNIFFKEDIMGNGAIFNSITKNELENIKILTSKELQYKFNAFVEPIDKEIEILVKKNNSLVKTRDLLLPRLMSAELSIE